MCYTKTFIKHDDRLSIEFLGDQKIKYFIRRGDVRAVSEYVIGLERIGDDFSAYVPDLPGCVATGDSLEAVVNLIHDAIEFHLEDDENYDAEIAERKKDIV